MMDKKKFNKSLGKAMRTMRTEKGGATAGKNGSRAVTNIANQLGFNSTVSVYAIERGENALYLTDFVLYCRAMQMSNKEIAEFFEKKIVELIK